jgi:hypothetical protein
VSSFLSSKVFLASGIVEIKQHQNAATLPSFRKHFLKENEVPLSTESFKKFVIAICCRLRKETKLSVENKLLEEQGRLAKVCFCDDIGE